MFSRDSVNKRSLQVKRDLEASVRSKKAKQELDAAAAAKRQATENTVKEESNTYTPVAMRSKAAQKKHAIALAAALKREDAAYLERKKKEKTMKEDFAPIGDMISLVANQQPGEATVIVNDLLSGRVTGALQTQKQFIAQNLFAPGVDALQEEIVQEEHESVEDFIKRGGKVKQVPSGKAHGSQKKQTIKVPFRMGKSALR